MTPHKRSSLRGRYREVWSAVYASCWAGRTVMDDEINPSIAKFAAAAADRAVEELYAHEHPTMEVKR